jgi:hypothetical protein
VHITRNVFFLAASAACFIIAALCAGGVAGWPSFAWGFGGAAAYVLAAL